MILQIKDITGALNKISDMVKGDKTIPGVLFNILDESVEVCYNDGHKAFIERIPALTDETDVKGKIVMPYENIIRAIGNCQPSGIIKVRDLKFNFNKPGVINIVADRFIETASGDGTVVSSVGKKSMDVQYIDVANTQDQKAKLLNRMNYESIFEVDGDPDEWDKAKLIDTFNKVSAEKGRQVYMSSKIQKIYAVNTAYTCAVPAPVREVKEDEYKALYTSLEQSGNEAMYETQASKLGIVLKRQYCIATTMTSMASSVLSKVNTEDNKIYMHNKDGYVCIFNSDNSVGIYFEQSKPSKVQVGAFDRFVGFNYNKYHLTLLREVLVDCIKSAVNSSKSEKTSFTFKKNENNETLLVIVAQNSQSSVNDIYDVVLDTVRCSAGDIESKIITISLKTFSEMLSQLKSDLVGIDISEENNGQICMRLSEINVDKTKLEWAKAREELKLPLEPVLDQPMPATPVDVVMGYRDKTLDTCQYSLVTITNKQ